MIDGGLLTRDFLNEGILATPQWAALDTAAMMQARHKAETLLASIASMKTPTEAVTEKDLIYPLLQAIGWGDLVYVQPNASAKGRSDVPDALLFADTAQLAKARAEPEDFQRFQHGLCLVEAKRWGRPLDREEKARKDEPGTPSSQMLRYLRRADDLTKGSLRWGILTNGRLWRLYFHGALSVAEDFLEIDLGKVFDLPGCPLDLLDKRPERFADYAAWRDHVFRVFLVLFTRTAFLPSVEGDTFHALALRQGKFWEARVAKSLSDTVFTSTFPMLADAIARADLKRPAVLSPAYLDKVRQGALILLYRLLFVLYAEDRNLLPDDSGNYRDVCLTQMRLKIASNKRRGIAPSASFGTYWSNLASIFRAISAGDDTLGIPPYNGGLFDPASAPVLERVQLPDTIMSDVIFGLSHQAGEDGRDAKYINYRDLSVQQLGSVYERILDFGLKANDNGDVVIDADDEARHKSGSYYTPEDLVSLIISRAVGPPVAERLAIFKAQADTFASDKGPTAQKLEQLAAHDPAIGILALKICDPAMGSGHFLVSLVDWLADAVLGAMVEAAASVSWGQYVSPLAARIAAIRAKILAEARAHKWPIVEAQLDDRHVVRRMVLKRVVYGVDKNPMAVELAKVALWLHSFTVGAPLSFLDHHLRSGDSVIGAWVRPTVDALQQRGALFNLGQITRVEQVAGLMAEIEETTDNDIAEVSSSKAKFRDVEQVTDPVAALFSLLTAEQLLGIFDAAPKTAPDLRKLAGRPEREIARAQSRLKEFEQAAALQLVLEGTFDPLRIANGQERIAPPELITQLQLIPDDALPEQSSLFPSIGNEDRRRLAADALVADAKALADHHHFFHWEIGFPNVWSNLTSAEPPGGFDAVIGNPPYVRQELLGDQVKRALKKSYAAYDGMADLYVYFYEQGLKLLKPGGRMSYVVTNKWLKAGYAENLRGLFADKGWLEFVADFGHAKHFFPDADVFPCVLVVRKPDRALTVPENADICVIPRAAVPRKGLEGAVVEATFPLPRAMFTKESWVLEPKPVMDLLDKIRRNGVPLAELIGSKPINGVKTGFNEAFLIDAPTRDLLVQKDPICLPTIKRFRRGQDIQRWVSEPATHWMIALSSHDATDWPWSKMDEASGEAVFAACMPTIYRRMKSYETDLKTRSSRGKFWWEMQTGPSSAAFDRDSIIYQEIQFYPCYALNERGILSNNKTFLLPTNDRYFLGVLNSPLMWWHNWRFLPHMKDEALSPMSFRMENLPLARGSDELRSEVQLRVSAIMEGTESIQRCSTTILDWLRHEFGLEKPGQILTQPEKLTADTFAAAVRKALPKSQKLSAAAIARLKAEHAQTITPARHAAAQALALEHQLSTLVNAAYGLTPEEEALMWATAPARMPFVL